MHITGSVEFTFDTTTAGGVRAFVAMCDLAGVPDEAPIRARTTPGRLLKHLRQLNVVATSRNEPAGAVSPPAEDPTPEPGS